MNAKGELMLKYLREKLSAAEAAECERDRKAAGLPLPDQDIAGDSAVIESSHSKELISDRGMPSADTWSRALRFGLETIKLSNYGGAEFPDLSGVTSTIKYIEINRGQINKVTLPPYVADLIVSDLQVSHAYSVDTAI